MPGNRERLAVPRPPAVVFDGGVWRGEGAAGAFTARPVDQGPPGAVWVDDHREQGDPWALAQGLFAASPSILTLLYPAGQALPMHDAWLAPHGDTPWRLDRAAFWQGGGPWAVRRPPFPEVPVMNADGRRHPRRPPVPAGELYRRYDVDLGAWVSLRTLDRALDLERFHRWQNSERVAAFWEEAGSLEAHRAYLDRLFDDPRSQAVIGCLDDDPFAYFEVYWAKEDRIAPYCDADDYDRGIHMLVGEDRYRGPRTVKAWLTALCHYLFLDDPRTRRVLSEPRFDNRRMIDHLLARRFAKLKEFDFPHKRAALMSLSREAFFEHCELS